MTSEAAILKHAKAECLRLGLRFLRLSFTPGVEVGWADVLVLGPELSAGQVLWMETKRRGQPLKPIQAYRRDEINIRGGRHCKPDTKKQVTHHLEEFRVFCEGNVTDA